MIRRSTGLVALVGIALALAACGTAGGSGWLLGPTLSSAPESSAAAPPPSVAPSTGAEAPSTEPSPSTQPSPTVEPPPSATPEATEASWTFVEKKPCPESRFECVTLAVPKDHAAAPGGPTWDITFAIQRAAKDRIGTFVVITGGPGTSGISVADGYTDYYAKSITDSHDIVFIDQRGVGLSGEIQCIDAAAAFYSSPARVQAPAERAAAADAARTFATDCIAEAGIDEADLPLYATSQAVEDLEAVRQYLEVDKMDLYGESYGTQFVQTYAAAHPDHLASLFVDGPVDMDLDGPTYYIEATRSADDTLIATLDDCTAERRCAADVKGRDALAAYDALATRLDGGPVAYDFTTATGATETRELTIADLENAAFGYIYGRTDREVLQRAIASASNGNLVPLARAADDSLGIDPETGEAEVDPGWSDALYYAVECQDYAFYPDAGDSDARLDAWAAAATDAGIDDARLATSFFGDLPCIYWPSATTADSRPGPLLDPPFPVFVLTSTTDPATPIANGMRIYSRLSDGWFFQALGGPHVIFAWGEPCPDDAISDFIAHGTLPATRVTTCPGRVADAYVPIAPTTAAGYDDALDLMSSTDDQILNTDDYIYRFDYEEPLTIGCDFGGTMTYAPTKQGFKAELDGCAFTPNVRLTGVGRSNDNTGAFRMSVRRGADRLTYVRDRRGALSVTGRYRGSAVDQRAAG
jgi:pimeloyl-ACP methyl ester carboxylesterase